MKVKNFVFIPLFLISIFGYGQTVSIKSVDEVCLNEVISFQAVLTGTATSYSWDFGDGGSSSQSSPSYSYGSVGSKTVKVTVIFSGGTQVSSSKTILVHDLPTADFDLSDSEYCFSSQNICLVDNSTMGSTTNGYSRRLILWGDGSQNSSSSPSSGQKTCFGNYPKAGVPYTIVIEVVNDKGCEAKWETSVKLLQDYQTSFSPVVKGATCDDQEVCFLNANSSKPSSVQSFEWDFGDGNKNTTTWNNLCHKYTTSGTYQVKLRVTLSNGCTSEIIKSVTIKIVNFETDVTIDEPEVCFPNPIFVKNPSIAGGKYVWELYNPNLTLVNGANGNAYQRIDAPCPGDYLVKLTMTVGNCTKTSGYIPVKFQGVVASFLALNNRQCRSIDPVYFVDRSKKHPDAVLSYDWDFKDALAPQCTGSVGNCNFEIIQNPKHLYIDTGCIFPELTVTDITSGCSSSYYASVKIVDTKTKKHGYTLDKPCLGNKSDYGVKFRVDYCDPDTKVCLDSLKNPNKFQGLNAAKYHYASVADPDGWVTIGFAMQSGEAKVYRSADSTDFYFDNSRICKDTIWFHNWFQLHPDPKMDFDVTSDTTCLPITRVASYYGSEEGKLAQMEYTWDLSNFPLSNISINPDTIPDLTHTYTQEGDKTLYIRIEDSYGCYAIGNYNQTMGYINSFAVDTLVCANSELNFYQYLRYYSDNTDYWSINGRPEKLNWDFGLGDGFTVSGPNPKFTFSEPGTYTVRMASNDKNGCVDTFSLNVNVNGINAAIKDGSKGFLCDQITQFFDSSYFDFTPTSDKIVSYLWDFGDFTTTSTLKNPFHYYRSNGDLIITLIVTTEQGCRDTAKIPVYLNGPEPYFEFTSDSVGCVPLTVSFKSNSTNVSSFIWKMGDSNNSSMYSDVDTAFSFTYDQPGTYYVTLEGSDSFYNEDANNTYTCSTTFPNENAVGPKIRKIIVLPIPEVHFLFDEPACINEDITFENNSNSIYEIFHWEVDGQKMTTSGDLGTSFDSSGTYVIRLLPTYEPSGPNQRECFDTFSNTIFVDYVKADFSIEQKGICNEFYFTDSSINATDHSWDFGHPSSNTNNVSSDPNPYHKYGIDAGEFLVCLEAKSQQGCKDVICKEVTSIYTNEIKPYNVFTPNGDGFNDSYLINTDNLSNFNLKIYNRWGELVFQSYDSSRGWEGYDLKSGEQVPEGTYFYVLRYTFNCEKMERLVEGAVQLIRD